MYILCAVYLVQNEKRENKKMQIKFNYIYLLWILVMVNVHDVHKLVEFRDQVCNIVKLQECIIFVFFSTVLQG